MLPFTPRLIPAILPNLAHHVPMIQSAAMRTNKLLTKVIQDLPYPVDKSSRQSITEKTTASRTFTGSPTPSRQPTLQAGPQRDASSPESMTDGQPSAASDKPTAPQTQKSRSGTAASAASEIPSRPQSRTSSISTGPPAPAVVAPTLSPPVQEEQDEDEDEDIFDYVATVNGLTVQFLSEHEQTRVAALQWLIMLHQKAPKKVCD
jgi:vacuole morphology and inheritance protein 14